MRCLLQACIAAYVIHINFVLFKNHSIFCRVNIAGRGSGRGGSGSGSGKTQRNSSSRKKKAKSSTDTVHCVCSSFEDSGSMVECETCSCWSHCKCVGLTAAVAPSYPPLLTLSCVLSV